MKTLRCPNCNAPVRIGSEKCEYCGSWFCNTEKIHHWSMPIMAEMLTANELRDQILKAMRECQNEPYQQR